MEKVTPPDPQPAIDYDGRTTAAVKSVLIEVGQILGAFRGKFAVIGGAVPWLLLNNEDMPHVGTLDIDLASNWSGGSLPLKVARLMSSWIF